MVSEGGGRIIQASISTDGEFSALSENETWGWMEAPAPVLKWLPTQVYTLEEQIYRAMAAMVNQPKQHAIIKLRNKIQHLNKT
jgi:hypothetical protein